MKAMGGTFAVAALAASVTGCAMQSGSGWTTLIDGTRGLDNFTPRRRANWAAKDGAIEASAGGKDNAYLVTKNSYKQLRRSAWNSGRATMPTAACSSAARTATASATRLATKRISSTSGRTRRMPPARSSRWRRSRSARQRSAASGACYEITANGPQLTLVLNGMKTVDVRDTKFASGPIALQWGRGTIKFRKVEIKPL